MAELALLRHRDRTVADGGSDGGQHGDTVPKGWKTAAEHIQLAGLGYVQNSLEDRHVVRHSGEQGHVVQAGEQKGSNVSVQLLRSARLSALLMLEP